MKQHRASQGHWKLERQWQHPLEILRENYFQLGFHTQIITEDIFWLRRVLKLLLPKHLLLRKCVKQERYPNQECVRKEGGVESRK